MGFIMHRKSKPDNYIEPMPKKQFQKIVKEFKEIGGMVVMGKEVDAYLQKKGQKQQHWMVIRLCFHITLAEVQCMKK